MMEFLRRFARNRPALVGVAVLAAVAALALLAPAFYPRSPFEMIGKPFEPPLAGTLLGTDQLGRDVTAGVVHGARVTLLIGLVATFIAILLGVTLGGIAGYFGGWVDTLLMRLTEIFSIHGEDFYRRLERDTLTDLLSGQQSMVLAVGGGLVTAPETYALLLRQTTTIWLKAKADDCWTRVIRQGDRRPMEQHPQAKEALKQLVARRDPLYARAAITVDTSALSIPQAVDRAERAVRVD